MALILQGLLDHLPFYDLPPAWTDFNFQSFSPSKTLWDYQQIALQNALKALWRYYEENGDYRPGEDEKRIILRKDAFYQDYLVNGLKAGSLDLPLSQKNNALLPDYYPSVKNKINYLHFINRINFWMATGSGKTVVIVKLLEILWNLMQRGEIPQNEVLVLSHRDELLEQIQEHIAEFNAARGDLHIQLHELRSLPNIRRGALSLFRNQELIVYYYRSDNLSDEQKEKIIDFRNYENNGNWYILLDEAHKGDREDSKRQHIYSILSRNGFLFNFSATFTDPRDILTTAFDFNLARFIQAGYGKHLAILQQENRAFRDDEDYTDAEKQKIVIKALLLLAYAHKAKEKLAEFDLLNYHRPLLVTLVNSVNTQDADLKLFFRQIERIGAKDVDSAIWQAAKDELRAELDLGVPLLFEQDAHFGIQPALYESLSLDDILASVYNAPAPGEMEVILRPSNRQEIAFQLKSAARPFALIRIGDISGWISEELEGYEISEGFSDESYFEQINTDDSDINLLMGSRTFYEGWDSNRPNIITYINIGIGTDAKKFITQSIGRGVRVEPMRGERKRLQPLYNARKIPADLYRRVSGSIDPLETLLILGTKRSAIQTVIEQMDVEANKDEAGEIAMQVNQDAIGNQPLLIPVYRKSQKMLIDQRDKAARFVITPEDLALLQSYWTYLNDDRLLFALHHLSPTEINLIRRTLTKPDEYYNTAALDARPINNIDLLLPRVARYFSLLPEEFDTLKLLENEIRHFQHIRVYLDDLRRKELEEKIKKVASWTNISKEDLKKKLGAGEIDIDEYTELITQAAQQIKEEKFHEGGVTLHIRYIAKHYYIPLILSDRERVSYIRSIIHYESEVKFINALESYYQEANNKLKDYDWWLFSRIDDAQDDIYIPYYHHDHRIAQFRPDFIFWLRKGDEYTILFVDPKGISRTDYERKVDGFSELFEDQQTNKSRVFTHNGMKVKFKLKLYTVHDANALPKRYQSYWLDRDRIGEMF